MSKNSEHHDTYIIPPNFIEGSTLFGGMFKIRNVIEAGVLAAAVGVPVFSLDLSLTVRIIILCLTALPLALFALMGIAGEPLSSYIIRLARFAADSCRLRQRGFAGNILCTFGGYSYHISH